MSFPASMQLVPLAMDWLLVAALLWQHFLTFVGFGCGGSWMAVCAPHHHLASRPPRNPLVYGLSLSEEANRGQPSVCQTDQTSWLTFPNSVPIEASVWLFRLQNDFVMLLGTSVRHHRRLPVTLSVQQQSTGAHRPVSAVRRVTQSW